MKKLIIMFATGLLTQQITQAQGIIYLSNLGQASTGNVAIGSDSWLAADFFTGNNVSGYALNSVQLEIADASGNPSGFTAMIYSAITGSGINPESSLGTLDGSLSPVTAGTYTYTDDSNIILSPHKFYYIVLTAGTAIASGAYNWSLAGTYSYNASGGWAVGNDAGTVAVFHSSSNGSSWNSNEGNLQFSITATAIPEPSTLGLLGLGGLGLLWHRRKAIAV